jgi:quercetin dioxygenase-like cupin family protein
MVVVEGSEEAAMGTLHAPLTGQHLQFRKTGKQTGGRLLEAEVLLDPGGHVPRHLHLRQDERVQVLEGSLSIQLGDEERRLAEGDSAEVPRRTLHRVSNTTSGTPGFCYRSAPHAGWRPPCGPSSRSLGCSGVSATAQVLEFDLRDHTSALLMQRLPP